MLKPRPGILDIAPYVPGRSGAAGIARPIKLSSNETPLGPSPRAVAAFHETASTLHRYPEGSSRVLREAIARHHGLDAERIVCGAGSDELIALLARAYAGPGDDVLMSRHGFSMYPIVTRTIGARLIMAPETNCTASVDAMLAAVTPATRIVFLANPNNPTGTYLPADEVLRLHAGLGDDVLLVLDSAYAEYAEAEDYDAGRTLVDAAPNVVMTRTFSKLYGLAALRIGWMYGQEEVVAVMNRMRGPFNVSIPAMAAGVAAIEDTGFAEAARAHNREWLPWVAGQLGQAGLEIVPSAANFLLIRFPAEAGRTADDADVFLTARGLILRKVADYGLPDCLRATIGTEEENRALVTALTEFMRIGNG